MKRLSSPASIPILIVAIMFIAPSPAAFADAPETGNTGGATVTSSAAQAAAAHEPAHADSLRMWQSRRRQNLAAPNGWLSVAGFFWLEPGENRFGTAPDNRVVLPAGTGPEHAGVFTLAQETGTWRVTVRADSAAAVMLNDEPLEGARRLYSDASGRADVLKVGRISLFVIERNGGFAIRMRDPESSILKNFAGVEYYPVDENYRVIAAFHRYDQPRRVPVPNFKGYTDSMDVPGELRFTLNGVPCTLLAFVENPRDSTLFIVFSDSTTGAETYGGGRFLYTRRPEAEEVTLDFNMAYNPPCVFTPHTTCPQPPRGNDLPIAVRAGEKMYRAHE